MKISSYFIPVAGNDTLHLKRFRREPAGPPVFMLHGAIENGRVFYSRSGKGLAPYLAQCGFDVYVADLRGHGESTPPIVRASSYGQTEAIVEDIPAFISFIRGLTGVVPAYWVAHSWGGVLLSSFLARHPEYCANVSSIVYFGTKRKVRVRNFDRHLKVDLIWNLLCPLVTWFSGYLPARQLGIGSDNETAKYLRQCREWVHSDQWVDSDDGFDYGAAIRKIKLPPIWYIAARNDHALGNPADVCDLMNESGMQESRYTVLSLENGNRHNYDHITMLTHPDAVNDHFPQIADWFRQHETVRQEKKRVVNFYGCGRQE